MNTCHDEHAFRGAPGIPPSAGELRHLLACAACRSERDELSRLRSYLVEHATPRIDPDTKARLWQRIVAERLQPPRTGRRWPRAAVAVAFAVAAAVLIVRQQTPGVPRLLLAVGDAKLTPPVVVDVEPGADCELTASQDGRVVLRAGAATIRVNHTSDPPRLRVVVPDGLIEDVGTVFRVEVRGGVTTSITVDSGAVVFHRRSGGSVFVDPGAPWSWKEPSSAPSPAGPVSQAAKAPRATPAATASSGLTPEDAMYLRVVSLARAGRKDEARGAAEEYLTAFPNGFRRAEVEVLTRLDCRPAAALEQGDEYRPSLAAARDRPAVWTARPAACRIAPERPRDVLRPGSGSGGAECGRRTGRIDERRERVVPMSLASVRRIP